MQITKEQFDEVVSWLPVCVPVEDWPNPRSTQDERTFYVAMQPISTPAYVLRKVEFMRHTLHGMQTIA